MDTSLQNKFNKAAIDLGALSLKRTADKAASVPVVTYSTTSKSSQAAAALSNLSSRASTDKLVKASRATQALSVVSATSSRTGSATQAVSRVDLEQVDDETVEIRVGGRVRATLILND